MVYFDIIIIFFSRLLLSYADISFVLAQINKKYNIQKQCDNYTVLIISFFNFLKIKLLNKYYNYYS